MKTGCDVKSKKREEGMINYSPSPSSRKTIHTLWSGAGGSSLWFVLGLVRS